MNNKLKTVLVSALVMLASGNTVFALDCSGVLNGYCLTNNNATFQIDAQGKIEMTVKRMLRMCSVKILFLMLML